VNNIVFSCTLLVNVIGVIVSFASWREKLFPFGEKLEPAPITKHSELPIPTKSFPGSPKSNFILQDVDPIVTAAWS